LLCLSKGNYYDNVKFDFLSADVRTGRNGNDKYGCTE
jgi:hypothetical protein